jgi:hypothetical protein
LLSCLAEKTINAAWSLSIDLVMWARFSCKWLAKEIEVYFTVAIIVGYNFLGLVGGGCCVCMIADCERNQESGYSETEYFVHSTKAWKWLIQYI